jgi:protein SCO1/2
MRSPQLFRSDAGRASGCGRLALLLPLLLCGTAFLCDTALAAGDGGVLTAGVFSPARPAADFTLRGSNGGELALGRYRGKIVLLSFGYTSCTAVCPITLAVLAQARRQLGPAGADVQVVYVTVDPARDSIERLHQYLANFDASFIGATGTEEQLAAVRKSYGIIATKIPTADGYEFAHSSSVYLIDRDGSLRAMMPFGHAAADYVHDIRLLSKK